MIDIENVEKNLRKRVEIEQDIEPFKEAMIKKMLENYEEKGNSWKNTKMSYLNGCFNEEMEEWGYELPGNIEADIIPCTWKYWKEKQKELIDVANFAMMLWNRIDIKIKKQVEDA